MYLGKYKYKINFLFFVLFCCLLGGCHIFLQDNFSYLFIYCIDHRKLKYSFQCLLYIHLQILRKITLDSMLMLVMLFKHVMSLG